MAGQHISRRQLLEALACASFASAAPTFLHWSYAFAESPTHGQHEVMPHSATAVHGKEYAPLFFTAHEYATVVLLAELILPANEAARRPADTSEGNAVVKAKDAGATDAGTAEFIDFMAAHTSSLQTVFRKGLAWLDGISKPDMFLALDAVDQNAILERLAYRAKFRGSEEEGQRFFATMRRYTVMGFYTSRIGLESLDYPGLRFYAESPAVPQDGSLLRLGVA